MARRRMMLALAERKPWEAQAAAARRKHGAGACLVCCVRVGCMCVVVELAGQESRARQGITFTSQVNKHRATEERDIGDWRLPRHIYIGRFPCGDNALIPDHTCTTTTGRTRTWSPHQRPPKRTRSRRSSSKSTSRDSSSPSRKSTTSSKPLLPPYPLPAARPCRRV